MHEGHHLEEWWEPLCGAPEDLNWRAETPENHKLLAVSAIKLEEDAWSNNNIPPMIGLPLAKNVS